MSDAAAAETLSVTGHHPSENWPGVARGVVCSLGAVAIAWHTPEVARYALGVLFLVASPALARTVVAPFLARILRSA